MNDYNKPKTPIIRRLAKKIGIRVIDINSLCDDVGEWVLSKNRARANR